MEKPTPKPTSASGSSTLTLSPLYLPHISKVFDAFLSHKITDAKDIVLGWYNTLSAMTYKPFLDRLSLDKVENIPRYITETATVLIAVTTNLFESYWCAVELCKAVERHSSPTRSSRPNPSPNL